MTQTVSVDEAPAKLPDLLAQALAGNEVIIRRARSAGGAPGAGCGSLSEKKPVAGRVVIWRGTISTSEDFDEPLPDEFWLGQE